ncbi:MAG: GDP-mannose 4,6-dehydratase [Bryobacteraceae bacterium]|nr:GDP-mannose 4,6-dehydratase [Bryobacteraceae bacterium]
MKRALITGITGQDGSYLAELLIAKGYEVHGIVRRASSPNLGRIDHINHESSDPACRLHLHYGDLTDGNRLARIIEQVRPDEVYNLGAQSHVAVSFVEPCHTADSVAQGALRLLEAIRDFNQRNDASIRFYQAGSSEMFGSTPPPQSESTPFHPRSPYSVAKLAAHFYTVNFRESYGMFACNGILFNHESPRRGEGFVTRKITRALTRIKLGLQDKLLLGNLEARRDWGFAGDYVEAMWLMLQQEQPDDYVVSTGEAYSVREFLEEAASHLGLETSSVVVVDPRYFRPAEVDYLLGDCSKATRVLGWKPKVSFRQLVAMMVEHDLELAYREKAAAEDSAVRRLAGAGRG